MNRTDWLQARQLGIGSSDAPNIVGLGFRSPGDVYRDKIEPVSDAPPKGILRRGLDLEDTVAAMYVEVMGVNVAKPARDILAHPQRPWQLASVDRVRAGGLPVELKTTAGFGDGWGPSGSDEVPDGYRIQCLHQMGVMGVESCDLVALDVIAWEPRVYRLMFDADLWAWLTAVQTAFWSHVVERDPPPADFASRFEVPIAAFTKGKAIDLGQSVADVVAKRKEFGRIRDEADAEYKACGRALEAAMGDAEVATAGDWKLKRVTIPGSTFTVERDPYTRLDVRALKRKAVTS